MERARRWRRSLEGAVHQELEVPADGRRSLPFHHPRHSVPKSDALAEDVSPYTRATVVDFARTEERQVSLQPDGSSDARPPLHRLRSTHAVRDSPLPTFDVPRYVAVHFEQEKECDQDGFNEFVQHLRSESEKRHTVSEMLKRSFVLLPQVNGGTSAIQVQIRGESVFGWVGGDRTPDRPGTSGGSCLLL